MFIYNIQQIFRYLLMQQLRIFNLCSVLRKFCEITETYLLKINLSPLMLQIFHDVSVAATFHLRFVSHTFLKNPLCVKLRHLHQPPIASPATFLAAIDSWYSYPSRFEEPAASVSSKSKFMQHVFKQLFTFRLLS